VDSSMLDTTRLTSSPQYSEDFFSLVERFIESPLSARYAPLAGELRFFGPEESIPSELVQLQFGFEKGSSLLDYLVGFVIRHFSIPNDVFTSLPKILPKYTSDSKGR
jgi:hypothetical protein